MTRGISAVDSVFAILSVALSSVSALAGFSFSICQAKADTIVFAGGDAGAQYENWYVATQPTYINQFDPQQGITSASAGASATTGWLSHSTFISDGNGGLIAVDFQAIASSSFTSTAELGSLHVYSNAGYEQIPGSASVMGYDASGTPYYQSNNNPITVSSGANGYASMEDRFLITSPTLPRGTPVHLRLTGSFDGSGIGGDAILSANLDGSYSSSAFFGGPAGDFYLEVSNDMQQVASKTVTLTAYVGMYEYLNATLTAGASVPFGVCKGSSYPWGYDECAGQNAYENASDTANIYLDPVGSDFSISFDSRHNYSTPSSVTPLPTSLPLFATGLCGLGVLGWRRNRKAAALAS